MIQLGQLFASISLAFGLFFFIFAAKYYISVAIVMVGKNKIANRNTNHLNGNGFSKNGNGNNSKRTEHNGGNPFKSTDTTDQGKRKGHTNGVIMAKIGQRFKDIFSDSIIARITNLGGLFRSKRAVSIEAERKQENGNGANGGKSNGNNHQPFVSIHLPFYNEKNVADRILKACTSLDYENYEVIVADDSIDETVEILKKWKDHPKVKVIHRESRKGWKGGALNEALKQMDPRAEYVMVFDADFVPPPDIVQQFLPYFGNNTNGNRNGNNGNNRLNGNNSSVNKDEYQRIIEKLEEWYRKRELAVVQGYQWHYLNAGENWLTKGIRAEYSSSYVIERTSQELIGSMKMIAGSVFMIKADIIKKYAWSTSMTEDWELTLRLYLDGYKVSYTPYIQAPAECPSTIPQLTRQRMRWAEGHTFNVKKYFWEVLRSPKISTREKLEFAYYAPYYLQSFIFLIGTSFWFLSEAMHQYLPFWTQVFGWSLLLSNLLALPFMGLTGLFLEKNVRRDFAGILSFIVMSYILVPFQAYASMKGLLEKKERGFWARTLKTGKITEVITKLRLGKVWREIFPRRKAAKKERLVEVKSIQTSNPMPEKIADLNVEKKTIDRSIRTNSIPTLLSKGLRKIRIKGPILVLMIMSAFIGGICILSTSVPEASGLPSGGTTWYLYTFSLPGWGDLNPTPTADSAMNIIKNRNYQWYSISSYDEYGWNFPWTLTLVITSNDWPSGAAWTIEIKYTGTRGTDGTTLPGGSTTWDPYGKTGTQTITISPTANPPTGTYFVELKITTPNTTGSPTVTITTNSSTGSKLYVPETLWFLLFAAPLIPFFISSRKRKGPSS